MKLLIFSSLTILVSAIIVSLLFLIFDRLLNICTKGRYFQATRKLETGSSIIYNPKTKKLN